MNTITADQAATRVEEHVQKLAAAIQGARLEPLGGLTIDPCNQPNDGGRRGRVSAGRTYWLRDVPQVRNPATFDAAVRYWTGHGFRIIDDLRSRGRAFVSVEAPEPDFTTMSLSESVDGRGTLSIGASSDCVWPNGTPEPKTGS